LSTGSETLIPGVSCFTGDFEVNTNFVVDAQNNRASIFVIQIFGNYISSGGTMSLINGAQPCNIFFVIDGDFSPIENIIVFGIFLVAGNVIETQSIFLVGSIAALGPLDHQSMLLDNNGNIMPFDTVNIITCSCVNVTIQEPTFEPTPLPTPEPDS
jgi:hypothetical protein